MTTFRFATMPTTAAQLSSTIKSVLSSESHQVSTTLLASSRRPSTLSGTPASQGSQRNLSSLRIPRELTKRSPLALSYNNSNTATPSYIRSISLSSQNLFGSQKIRDVLNQSCQIADITAPSRRYVLSKFQSSRHFSTTYVVSTSAKDTPSASKQNETSLKLEEEEHKHSEESFDKDPETFRLSKKAVQASKVNLAARLSPRNAPNTGGMKEIFRLFTLARRETRPLILAVTLLFISSVVTLTLPLTIGKILDAATSEEEEKTIFGVTLPTFYTGVGCLFVFGAIANFGRVIILKIIGERLVARLRVNLFKKTISQDAEFFDANRVGDLISRLSSDAQIVAKSVTQNVSDGLRSSLSAIFGVGMMAYVSLKLTSIILLVVPPIFLGSYIYGRKVRQLSRELQSAVGELTKVSEERLSNVRTSQSFAGEIQEVHRYSEKIRDVFRIGKAEAIAAGSFFASTGFAGNLTVLSLLIIGSQMVSSGEMTLGALTSFTMYTGYVGSSAFGLSSFYSELMKGAGAASRLFELMDREPAIKPTVGKKLSSARNVISFENVKFSYPTRPAVSIFSDLTFSIPSGSNVCVVAPSGAGKSTITSLLLRFYDPTGGSIKIGNENIRDLNLKSLRRHIGVVSQEPVLFSGTIAENISYGKPEASRSEIYQAARRANCGFISDFPDGLDTHVGARGAQLSGGQKQRIAIARALIKNPSILILDEATSALDAESEASVNEALINLMDEKNTTTISIAHRLSTIKRSDQIIVLSTDGKVAEIGAYKELITNPNSALSDLLKAQAGDVPRWQHPHGEGIPANMDIVGTASGVIGGVPDDITLTGDGETNELVEEELDEELEQEADVQESRDASGIDIKRIPRL